MKDCPSITQRTMIIHTVAFKRMPPPRNNNGGQREVIISDEYDGQKTERERNMKEEPSRSTASSKPRKERTMGCSAVSAGQQSLTL